MHDPLTGKIKVIATLYGSSRNKITVGYLLIKTGNLEAIKL
jgi:hypothetical protein